MKNNCSKWKDQLLEAALTETTADELHDHLAECPGCAQKLSLLKARRERLDAVLPLLAGKKEPAPGFGARVLAAAEAQKARKNLLRQPWLLAAAAVIAVALVTVVVLHRPTASRPLDSKATEDTERAMAQKLAQWQAPSDALLATPGQEILRKMPDLGESYLKFPVRTNNKEK
jgi:anti-sigma factor RsiW